MSQSSPAGKILTVIAVLFVAALAAAGYYRFSTPTSKDPNAANSADAKANPAKPADPTPEQLAQLVAPQKDDVVEGKDSAPVTIVEYASLSCPHCGHFYEKIRPEIKKDLLDTGKAKLVFRHFPHNEPGLRAAQLVNCSAPKDRPALIKAFFDTQDNWAFTEKFLVNLKPVAIANGMDSAAFDSCVADKSGETHILEERKQAIDLGQVNSVPTFIINGVILKDSPTVEHIKAAVENAAKTPVAAASAPSTAAVAPVKPAKIHAPAKPKTDSDAESNDSASEDTKE